MAKTAAAQWMQRGRFDRSFVVRMIVDFFFVLLLVAAAELGLRFGLLVYDFYSNEQKSTRIAAEHLASDVRQIMINTGGPVAARTVYPILKRSQEQNGLLIAVTPSEVTTRSIEELFDFKPQGITPDWPAGVHHSQRIDIHAEEYCLSCHVEARLGDVLGTVEVRNYLSSHVHRWWEEVRLTGVMSLFKILLHSFVLFFLLKVRMEPLLSLRAVVSGLAKGGSDLSLRAPEKSLDEFGELAADLNHFLDRICHIIEDLHGVLGRIGELHSKSTTLQARLNEAVQGLRDRLTEQGAIKGDGADPGLIQSIAAFERLLGDLALQEEKLAHIAETASKLIERLVRRSVEPENGEEPVPNPDKQL